MAKTVGFPGVAEMVRAIGVRGGESCWGPPVLLLCLWKRVLAERTPVAAIASVLGLRAAAELGCRARYSRNYPGAWVLSTAPPAVVVTPVSEVQCVGISWDWG